MNREIELRHLRYFLAVAETLHFSQAASRLGIAQPALSHQIGRFEQLIGHRLFDRTTRGVKLTLAGQLLVERARSTLDKVQDDLEQVRRLGRGEDGMLTVGFSGSVMFSELPKILQTFGRAYPKVELRLRELSTAAQLGGLLDRTLDLAFLRDGDETAGVEITPLHKERYVAVLPVKHSLSAKSRLRVADLANEPFILFARRHGSLAFDRTFDCCQRSGFRPRVVQDGTQWPTIIRLVSAGMGVSLAPDCVSTIAIPGVLYRRVQGATFTTIDLGVRAGGLNALARNFADVSRRVFSG